MQICIECITFTSLTSLPDDLLAKLNACLSRASRRHTLGPFTGQLKSIIIPSANRSQYCLTFDVLLTTKLWSTVGPRRFFFSAACLVEMGFGQITLKTDCPLETRLLSWTLGSERLLVLSWMVLTIIVEFVYSVIFPFFTFSYTHKWKMKYCFWAKFSKWKFWWIYMFWAPLNPKIPFLNIWSACLRRVSVCYQHSWKTNWNRHSKFGLYILSRCYLKLFMKIGLIVLV